MIRTNTENRIHRVLWTGGFDSTYRMIELALQDVIVEPVYVVNSGRRSHNIELQSMQKMLGMLRDAKRFRAKIYDIKTINKEDIVIPPEIHQAYENLHQSCNIGPQYEWLSPLSRTIEDLEICIEKAPEGRLHSRDAIIAETEDARIIFGNFILSIFDKTEEDMLADIAQWGCEDIIKHIWFCNHPLTVNSGGYCACGLCHPCRIKIESGMSQLLPLDALMRNKLMNEIASSQGEDAAREYRMKIWTESGLSVE